MSLESRGQNVKWGLVLMNMGGPADTEGVEAFLSALLGDPHIIGIPFALLRRLIARRIARRRAPLVIPRYQAIGGGSPILAETEKQARALEELLGLPVEIAMRYTTPRAEEALDKLQKAGVSHVVALPLYPQESRATTRSSLDEILPLAASRGLQVLSVDAYPSMDGFITAMAELIQDRLQKLERPELVFCAHGLPERAAKKDVYPEHVRQTAEALADRLPERIQWTLAFQSRLGPVRWMKPYLDEVVRDLGKRGIRELIVVPISFVSEHIETLHELDIELRETALEAGIERFERVETVGAHPAFIAGLAEIISKSIERYNAEEA